MMDKNKDPYMDDIKKALLYSGLIITIMWLISIFVVK